VLTPTGVGTIVADGKQTIRFDGAEYLVERALRADFALINAHEADHFFNLTYRLTATNFNPLMALAAECVIAEAEEIVPIGVIPPDAVRTTGALVPYLLERRR
jgi:acetate CoA/acetoacetate CoA-transferase alpha subunit